jgi:iron complex outermembrane receptor protein
MEWLGRDNVAAGEEALSPPTDQASLSTFAYEELQFGRFRVQLGGRLERTAYRPGERPIGGHDHGDDEDAHEHEAPEVRDRTFVGASGSAGLHADIGATGAFVVNLTTASRAPALEELYSFGPHAGNLAFEAGSPGLGLERTFGLDVSLRRRASRVSGELNAFVYGIRDFVFLDFSGEVVDGLREADYRQADSRFTGAEASGTVELVGGSHLEASVSFVDARLTATDEPLPRIPPLSGRLRLEVPWRGVTFTPEIVLARAQREVFRGETPTAGYALVNFGASYFVVRGHATHAITLSGQNLLNEQYRLHTSFLKDLAPEMGRSVKLSYTVRFF